MSDRTVGLVTGAGRGMGRACAERLARTVDSLVVVDRDDTTLRSAANELGGGAEIVPMVFDVADRGAVGLLPRIREHGSLRAVAHAAGVSPTMATSRTILDVDLVGTALLIDALTPLVTTGTAALCFASMAPYLVLAHVDPKADAVLDDPLMPSFVADLERAVGPTIEDPGVAYSWAKRGVQRLVRRVAVPWGKQGGRICSVSPGMIDTPQGRQEAAAQPAMAELRAQTPLRREGTAEEIAEVVAFLLSESASFITGTDLLVDGGVCASVEFSGGITG